MSKQRLSIYIGLAIFSLILLSLAMTLIFLYNSYPRLYELPTGQIRPIFRDLAEKMELPDKADDLRAILQSGIDPSIFVRFQTDSEGIEYIFDNFGGSTAKKLETFSAELMKGLNEENVFPTFFSPSRWQEELGICLFDQNSIESGRLLKGSIGPRKNISYNIFIEDKKNIVYIHIVHI